MPKIISAKNYSGARIVIRVCLNPDDPEAVHLGVDGSKTAHTDADALPQRPEAGKASWEWCRKCRYNWQFTELTWTGDEMYYLADTNTKNEAGAPVFERRGKTDDMLLAEVQSAFTAPTAGPTTITALEGKLLG